MIKIPFDHKIHFMYNSYILLLIKELICPIGAVTE